MFHYDFDELKKPKNAVIIEDADYEIEAYGLPTKMVYMAMQAVDKIDSSERRQSVRIVYASPEYATHSNSIV